MKQYWHAALLGLIITLGLFLRLWQLPSIPVGLHGDEASIGYNAYSLLKTGKDQNGVSFPLAIDQFGDFRPAGYHYLDIPFIKYLGLNTLAVRLPSALFGIATIAIFYFLVFELFASIPLALLSSSFLAISPWHINISRATSEGVVAGFFIILGFFLLLRAFSQVRSSLFFLILGFGSLFISFLFYHSARLFVPAFLIPFLGIVFLTRKPTRQVKTYAVVFMVMLIVALGGVMKFGQGAARPSTVSIFNIPGGDREIFQQIGEDGTRPAVITRILHNKALFYGRLFLASYFWHFNGEFLFNSTGMPIRYKIPWTANMYLVDLPLILVGAAALLLDGLRKKKYLLLLPLAWLAVGALPAGLTWEDLPNVQRASLMIPALLLISAYGLLEVLSLVSHKAIQKLFLLGYAAFLFYGFFIFFHNYFYHLPRHEPWHRSAATPELIQTVLNLKISQGNAPVIMTTESNNNFIFYLFYTAFDPAKFQQLGSPTERDGMIFDGLQYTVRPCPLGNNSEAVDEEKNDVGILFVNKATCKTPVNADTLATIRWTDGTPAFVVVKVNPDWKPE